MYVQTDHAPVTVDSNRDETAEQASQFCDASLLFLFSYMDMLQVDQRDLAADDPLLFRELQGRCSLCRHKRECAEDVSDPFAKSQRWREYCPNSAVLTTIGAIQNCGYDRAASQDAAVSVRDRLSRARNPAVAGFILRN